jgi:hypothetical protein
MEGKERGLRVVETRPKRRPARLLLPFTQGALKVQRLVKGKGKELLVRAALIGSGTACLVKAIALPERGMPMTEATLGANLIAAGCRKGGKEFVDNQGLSWLLLTASFMGAFGLEREIESPSPGGAGIPMALVWLSAGLTNLGWVAHDAGNAFLSLARRKLSSGGKMAPAAE